MEQSISAQKAKTFEPGKMEVDEAEKGLSKEEVGKIKKAIGEAKSLQEMLALERQLQTGQLPK